MVQAGDDTTTTENDVVIPLWPDPRPEDLTDAERRASCTRVTVAAKSVARTKRGSRTLPVEPPEVWPDGPKAAMSNLQMALLGVLASAMSSHWNGMGVAQCQPTAQHHRCRPHQKSVQDTSRDGNRHGSGPL